MSDSQAFLSYSPVGDVLAMAISFMLMYLLLQTFANKTRAYRLFQTMILMVIVAVISDMFYHFPLYYNHVGHYVIYIARNVHHIALFTILYLYVIYIVDYMRLKGMEARKFRILSLLGVVGISLYEIIGSVLGFGFTVTQDGIPREGFNIFFLGYLFFVGMIAFLLLRYQSRVIRPILSGIGFSIITCVVILGVQGRHHQSSFTTATFIIPTIAMMYLLHSNPYDPVTGAVNESSFATTIKAAYKDKKTLVLISLTLHDVDAVKIMSEDMQFEKFRFYTKFVKGGVLFRLAPDNLMLAFDVAKNPDTEAVIDKLKTAFDALYDDFHINYKGTIIQTREDLSRTNEYVALNRFLESRIATNTIYPITEEDIGDYRKTRHILGQLEDIEAKMDLDDPRILVYCQPVYNVMSDEYDTAEALMRMELPELGFVYPDMFIPLAEQHHLIHPLSLIILHKTCQQIKKLIDEGLHINRISVNFSMTEVRDKDFCKDIIDIIAANDIPYEKIAIELTETRNEEDFELVKSKINELKGYGIKFYLDDFGTGYSNFDRIMELPVDIIKFDRQLVIESSKDRDSEYMVYTFADMFNKLNYHVLYEGIETLSDEKRCIRMFAEYLQGYKYSKPIPIEELRDFLEPENSPDDEGKGAAA